jgi:hypothetical protein
MGRPVAAAGMNGCELERGALAWVSLVKPRLLIIYMCASLLIPALLGCSQRGSKTPGLAKERLVAAVAARDPLQLWRALDMDTQWSWMTIQRAGRESYDITLSNVPEGPQRERLVKRFEAAATAEDAPSLFARWVTPELWLKLAAQVAAAGDREPQPTAADQAEIALPDGTLAFHRGDRHGFGWGFSGLAESAEDLKRTASTDLYGLRANAADYERTATRGQR